GEAWDTPVQGSRFTGRDLAHHTEADQPVRVVGHGAKTVGGATGPRFVEPAAATNDAVEIVVVRGDDPLVRSLGIFSGTFAVVILVIIVRTPLGDIAVHVVQPPGVGLVGADLGGLAQIGPLLRPPIWEIAVEVRLLRGERLAE